jgi:hypothetical protein
MRAGIQDNKGTTMRSFLRLGILAACLLVPSIAAADDSDSGWYLGAGAGFTQASQAPYSTDAFRVGPPSGPSITQEYSVNSTGERLEAGYWFTPYIGQQFSIVDLGRYSNKVVYYSGGFVGCVGAQCGPDVVDSPRVKARGATMALTGRLPLSGGFDLVGRIGLFYSDTTYDDQQGAISSSPQGTASHYVRTTASGVYGASLGWNFRPHWELLLGADLYTGLGGGRFNTFNVKVLSLGVQYHF